MPTRQLQFQSLPFESRSKAYTQFYQLKEDVILEPRKIQRSEKDS